MKSEQRETLKKVLVTLNDMNVSGKQNWLILVTVMNELERMIKEDDA